MTRSTPRALLLLTLLGALVALGGVFGAPGSATGAAPGAPVACEARAGGATLAVVVDFGDGRVRTRCTEPGGSGVDVLRRAGFAPVTQSYGSVGGDAAVCAVQDPDTQTLQGCQSGGSCLTCLAPDSWGYFPAYRYSQIGAGDTQPGAGTVEAWRWGRSTSWGGGRPSVADVCGEPDPEPTPTTAPPVTGPSGGGGTTTPSAGGPSGGGGPAADPGPGDPTGPGGTGPGGGDPSTTGPGDSTTTAPGASSTTAPGATGDGATTTEAAEVEGATAARATDGDDDERADGVLDPTGGSGGSGGAGGSGGDGGAGSGARPSCRWPSPL